MQLFKPLKKKWIGIVSALLAVLTLASTTVPALADSEQAAMAKVRPSPIGALAIVAPWRAPVGEEVSMTVFERQNQTTVKDAGVWALTQESAEALKAEVEAIKEEGSTLLHELDWESMVSVRGTRLGTTNGSGQLKYTFSEEGRYVLVAVKRGYFPGRTGIAIKSLPQALAIEAPRRAEPGEKVTMTVFQRGTEDPVKDAAIWALTRENAEALKAEVEAIKEEGSLSPQEMDWESMVSVRGTRLGTTNGSGQLKHAFEEEGGYLLVALKDGYLPGRTGIAIRAPRIVEETPQQQPTQ